MNLGTSRDWAVDTAELEVSVAANPSYCKHLLLSLRDFAECAVIGLAKSVAAVPGSNGMYDQTLWSIAQYAALFL